MKLVLQIRPHVFITSHYSGLDGEVSLALPFLKSAGCSCILALRDIYNVEEFRAFPGVNFHEQVAEFYSAVAVLGTERTKSFLPAIPSSVVETYWGYVAAPILRVKNNVESESRIRVLCQIGGGVDGELLLSSVLRVLSKLVGDVFPELKLDLSTGPVSQSCRNIVLPYIEKSWISAKPWVRDVGLRDVYRLRISMGGYNSCVEAARSSGDALIIPRQRVGDTEQIARAYLFEELFSQIHVAPPGQYGDLMDGLRRSIYSLLRAPEPSPSVAPEGFFALPDDLLELI